MAERSFCLVSTFYPPNSFGGDAVHVHRLANGLAARGHRVRVVTGGVAFGMLSEEGSIAEGFEHHPGVEVVDGLENKGEVIATYLTGGPVGYQSRLVSMISGFDVVHFHNPSLVGGVGALRLTDADLKVYTTHEHWLLCPTHVLYRYNREICEKRTCWRCTIHYRRPPQLWRSTTLLDRSVASLDLLLAPSRFTARMHAARFPGADIQVLPLPGPSEDMLSSLPSVPEGTPNDFFLYAGRLEPIKGVDRLIRVAKELEQVQIVVAGSGSLEGEVKGAARTIPNLHFLGQQAYRSTLALCQAARAVVVPSSGYETFGGVAVEAMALSTPVVVRSLGPLPELVDDGGGWTFYDDMELKVLLRRLWTDPHTTQVEGNRAREVFLSRWQEDLFFKRYLELVSRHGEQ